MSEPEHPRRRDVMCFSHGRDSFSGPSSSANVPQSTTPGSRSSTAATPRHTAASALMCDASACRGNVHVSLRCIIYMGLQ